MIMTSNLGADRIRQHARPKESFEQLKEDLMEILSHSFRPEFINRIDEIIVFRALSEEQIAEITKLLLQRLVRRLRAQHVEIQFADEAVALLSREGSTRSTARGRCAGQSNGSSRTSSHGCCSTATSSLATALRSA